MRKDGRTEQGNQQENPILVDEIKDAGTSIQQKSPHNQNKNGSNTDKGKEKSVQGNRFDALLCNDDDQDDNNRNEMRNNDIQLENELMLNWKPVIKISMMRKNQTPRTLSLLMPLNTMKILMWKKKYMKILIRMMLLRMLT